MAQTPREIVRRCLRFEYPERLPRQVWTLPWATRRFADHHAEIERRWPPDIITAPDVYRPSSVRRGDAYTVGTYVDEWGCAFTNIHGGVIGEVREPRLSEISKWRSVVPPWELLPDDRNAARDAVNRACADSDRFVLAGCLPRPWERFQFIRGSEAAMMDVMFPEEGAADLLAIIHGYYLAELEFWLTTDVDAIWFMDDWGAQSQLLIPPPVWRELFKPLYRDYCDAAHGSGKFAFMHSDGHITEIYDDLVEIGVNALNSQLFCMDLDVLARKAKGRLTFWGEIDRQHVLPSPDPQAGRDAVRAVASRLYDPAGGFIVQFEFGPGANPDTAIAVLEEWDAVATTAVETATVATTAVETAAVGAPAAGTTTDETAAP